MTELQLQSVSGSELELPESSRGSTKKKHKNNQEVLLCWSFPRHGWYKLNVDGSYRSGCIAGGGVIRNQDGEWLSGFAENLGTGKKPIEAEVWALYRGLELAWNYGWYPIEVETDSAMAVTLVFSPVQLYPKHPQFNLIHKSLNQIRNSENLIRNCLNLLNQIQNYSLQHVYRQKNSVADFLANFGLTLGLGCHYFDAPPPGCEAVLVQDICRVAKPRSLLPTVIEFRGVKKLEELDIHKDDAASVTFTWKIDNFSQLNAVKHYSGVFVIGCFEWRILMYPRGKKSVGSLSVYLDVTGSSTLPKGWARYAQFSLSVVNQLQSSKSITKDTGHVFTKMESEWGFASLIPLSEFYNDREGYLVNDICIIEAKLAVHKSEIKLFGAVR
ncbi:hypothetical protein ACFX13_007378 [Malus domestica]|uniref:uncharacterized protein LOC126588554 n=1 Tax=Malus sylvestris TaxID=3752 RepID=UPI0021AD3465|nr:uncharacterized protein LOC126588554 [Malus sylvestris]